GPGGGRAVRLDPGAGPAPFPSTVLSKGLRPRIAAKAPGTAPGGEGGPGPSQRPRAGSSGPAGALLGLPAGPARAPPPTRPLPTLGGCQNGSRNPQGSKTGF